MLSACSFHATAALAEWLLIGDEWQKSSGSSRGQLFAVMTFLCPSGFCGRCRYGLLVVFRLEPVQSSPRCRNLCIIYATARLQAVDKVHYVILQPLLPVIHIGAPEHPPDTPAGFLADNGPHVVQIHLLRMQQRSGRT
ncbi:unnamed protein product, partial [Iphiclides podalirius]